MNYIGRCLDILKNLSEYNTPNEKPKEIQCKIASKRQIEKKLREFSRKIGGYSLERTDYRSMSVKKIREKLRELDIIANNIKTLKSKINSAEYETVHGIKTLRSESEYLYDIAYKYTTVVEIILGEKLPNPTKEEEIAAIYKTLGN